MLVVDLSMEHLTNVNIKHQPPLTTAMTLVANQQLLKALMDLAPLRPRRRTPKMPSLLNPSS